MSFLIDSPIYILNNATPLAVGVIVFCATTLATLTLIWVVIYILVRPIRNRSLFAPFENMGRRLFHLAVVTLSVVAGYAGSVFFKNFFKIGRPEVLNLNLKPFILETGYGFPSGHATVFAALATAVFCINRKAGVFSGLLALIIGVARILAGVHTPLDILGGYTLGITISLIINILARRIARSS